MSGVNRMWSACYGLGSRLAASLVVPVGRVSLVCGAAATITACSGSSTSTTSFQGASVECAPYARQVTGLQLFGDAADWWEAAEGRYQRSAEPSPGAVLVFQRSSRLPHGHVSVVTSLRSGREVVVTQANWVHGRIARSEPVVDVSPGNDWTAVRVWWEPSGQLGSTVYPAFGFIQPPGSGRPTPGS